jgi:hypothetical protein
MAVKPKLPKFDPATPVGFHSLFAGRQDAMGTGAGPVERHKVTQQHYNQHLHGDSTGIGIFPMLDTDEVNFAAIDLDEPNFELARTMQKLIPGESFIERSRSGNAHIWVFFTTAAPAWAVRAVLKGATEAVGRRDVEIFPKQDSLREGMVGNYINLPYHGLARPILDSDDNVMAVEDFVQAATEARQDPDGWVRRARALGAVPPQDRVKSSEFGESPVLHSCAEHIIKNRETNPLTPGHRAVVLFNLARQLLNYRDMTVDEARHWVHEVNKCGQKPMTDNEVDRQFENALAGKYTSTGCDDPVMAPYVSPECPIASGHVGR